MQYTIYYKGAVSGYVNVDADSLEEAIKKSDNLAIELMDLPDDWEVDKELTEELNDQ
jgi:hypothetical protein